MRRPNQHRHSRLLAALGAGMAVWTAGPALASHVGGSLVLDHQLIPATVATANQSAEEQVLDRQTIASTNLLLRTLHQYEHMPAARQAALGEQLTQMAAQRRELMRLLLEGQPHLAALRLLSPAVRSRLPPSAQAYVEERVTVRGSVGATVSDDFENGRSQTRLYITDANGQRFELHAPQATAREQLGWVGRRGAVRAVRLDAHLLVLERGHVQLLADKGSGPTSAVQTETASAAVQGEQSTLVIMLNFADKALACTQGDLQARLFGTSGATLDQGYRQSSNNVVSFVGNVIGPFNTSFTSTGSCDPNAWAAAGNAAALAAGFNPSSYRRVSYATPANATCGWTGLASLGGSSPTPSWVQSCASTGVFSHEIGHNLQFHHASTPTSEYGDSSDPMGASLLVQSNTANRVMAGWLNGSQVLDIAAGGSYAIGALENSESIAPRVLRMPKADTAETYYVSLRQGLGIDEYLPSGYKGALSVHYATGTMPAQTFRVANLSVGQSWTDSVNGITVTHQGLTSTGATVSVAIGNASCARIAPAFNVAPAAQSATPGSQLAYALTVTNNNAAACPPSTFNLSQTLPAGFTGSLGSASVVLAPGAATNVGWNVASSAASTDAVYTITASVSEASVSNSASAQAAYTVVSAPPPPSPPPVDTTPPTVAITNPTPNATLSGRTASIEASATDASGVASVGFYVDGKLLTTDAGAPYSTTLNLRKVSAGSHTILVRAVDTRGNAAEQSINVTVK